jgi:hypothetical protein
MRLNLSRLGLVPMLAVALVSASALTLWAEDTPKAPEPPARPPRPGDIQRVFTVEYASVVELANVLAIFPASIKTSRRPAAIGVSASPAVVAAIEATIKRLDVPAPIAASKDIELTGYVIKAERKTGGADQVPDALSGAVSQMRSLFGYGLFELLDVLVGRGSPKSRLELSAIATAPRSVAGGLTIYSLRAEPELVLQGAGAPSIRVNELRFSMKFPVSNGAERGFSYQDVGMRANVEAHPDQYIVVGKTGSGDDSGNDLILVIKARLAD